MRLDNHTVFTVSFTYFFNLLPVHNSKNIISGATSKFLFKMGVHVVLLIHMGLSSGYPELSLGFFIMPSSGQITKCTVGIT